MNKKSKQKFAQAFRLARTQIEQRKTSYICNAIDATCYRDSSQTYLAKRLIQSRIHPYQTLEAWVYHEVANSGLELISKRRKIHPKSFISAICVTSEWQEQMRMFRIRWLDELIAEFS